MAFIRTRDIKNSQVTAAKLASGAVTAAALGTGSVTAEKLGTGSALTSKLGLTAANKTGVSIAAGKLVYVSGYDATLAAPTIALADADAGGRLATWVTQAAIADSATGVVVKAYTLTAQNTNGRTVGDAVYLDTTAGGYTFTPPASVLSAQQVVGRVTVVNASTGVVAFDLAAEGMLKKIGQQELQSNCVSVGQLSTSVLVQVTTTITNAQMLALRATPITIAPAPGAGMVSEFVGAVIYQSNAGGGAYTETADNLGIKYTNGSGAQVSTDVETTGFIDQTSAQYRNVIAQKDVAMVANAALVIHNIGDGEFGGGNAGNVTKIVCSYRIHTLP